jgi:hypothetical protein
MQRVIDRDLVALNALLERLRASCVSASPREASVRGAHEPLPPTLKLYQTLDRLVFSA